MDYLKRAAVILAVLLGCVGCDQTTKSVAQAQLWDRSTVSFLEGSVRLELATNSGAFLGVGRSISTEHTVSVLLGISAILLALLVLAWRAWRYSRAEAIGWALMCGGGLGNLVDRLRDGYVVDFLNFGVGLLKTGIFNIADALLIVGLIVVLAGPRIERRFGTKPYQPSEDRVVEEKTEIGITVGERARIYGLTWWRAALCLLVLTGACALSLPLPFALFAMAGLLALLACT